MFYISCSECNATSFDIKPVIERECPECGTKFRDYVLISIPSEEVLLTDLEKLVGGIAEKLDNGMICIEFRYDMEDINISCADSIYKTILGLLGTLRHTVTLN